MTEIKRLRVIHLSDLHVSASNSQQIRDRIKALLKVPELAESIDAVVLSGDLANAGSSDDYKAATDAAVRPLLAELELTPSRLFIAPGNHDVDRKRISDLIQPGLRKKIQEADDADRVWRGTDRQLVLSRQDAFREFAQGLGLQTESTTIAVGGMTVGFLCLNSAWTSADDGDDGNLVITRAQFDDALERIEGASFKVGVWHHPLAAFVQSDSTRIRARVNENLDLVCMGHLHEDLGQFTASPRGQAVTLQAPAFLAKGSVVQNGFFLTEIASDRELRVIAYAWDDRSGSFIRNISFSPANGEWRQKIEEKTPRDIKIVRARSKESLSLQQFYEDRLNRSLPSVPSQAVATIERRFFDPRLSFSDGKQGGVAALISLPGSCIIAGPPQSGKTTLLEFVGRALSTDTTPAVMLQFSTVPEEVRAGSLARAIGTSRRISANEAERLLTNNVVLLVDECYLDPGNPRWKVLEAWRNEYASLRIIAAGKQILIGSKPGEKLPAWVMATLQPLTVARVVDEVRQVAADDGKILVDLDATLEALAEAELPRWPWVIAMLTQLGPAIASVNSMATLLEGYVKSRVAVACAKHAEKMAHVGRLLRVFAAHLTTTGRVSVPVSQFREVIKAAVSEAGLNVATGEAESLLGATKIVVVDGEHVWFAFSVLQEYLYAEFLRETVWAEVNALNSDLLIRRGGSLAFLAQLTDLPELVRHAFDVAARSCPEIASLESLDAIGNLQELLTSETPDQVVERAKQAAPSKETLEKTVTQREHAARGGKELRIAKGRESLAGVAEFGELLRIAVSILRGAMWLDKKEKVACVKTTLKLSAKLIAAMCNDADLRAALLLPISDVNLRKQFTTLMNALFVLVVASLVVQVGGAHHLEAAIAEVFDDTEDDLERVIALMWYVDIGGSGAPNLVSKLAKTAKTVTPIQIVEMWVYSRYVNSIAFESFKVAEQEDALRTLASARLSRTKTFETKGNAELKNLAEKFVQTARQQRQSVARATPQQ